jgi:hypothetical protein
VIAKENIPITYRVFLWMRVDFQSLEQDVDLRKAGVDRIYSVSKEYSKHLTKKIEAEGTETGKVLPADALGLVFANHGDEFGNDSAFGM